MSYVSELTTTLGNRIFILFFCWDADFWDDSTDLI